MTTAIPEKCVRCASSMPPIKPRAEVDNLALCDWCYDLYIRSKKNPDRFDDMDDLPRLTLYLSNQTSRKKAKELVRAVIKTAVAAEMSTIKIIYIDAASGLPVNGLVKLNANIRDDGEVNLEIKKREIYS